LNFFEKLIDFLDPLGSLAKICGVAGVSLGIFFLLFKEIIRKKLFSTLTKNQSYQILRLIILCCFGVAALGLIYGFLTYGKIKSDTKATLKTDTVNYEPLKLERKGVVVVDSTSKK